MSALAAPSFGGYGPDTSRSALAWRAQRIADLPLEASALIAAPAVSHRAGRWLAVQALADLGVAAPTLPRGPDGAPVWPTGVVGSIAHSAVHAVAVAARRGDWLALGVDVEPDLPLPADVAALDLHATERQALHHLWPGSGLAEARRVFCAKECLHKALNPLNGAWLEFDEVQVLPLDAERWQMRPLSAAARRAFPHPMLEGRWWTADGALWALLAVSVAPPLPDR